MTEGQKREDAAKVFLSYTSKDLAFVEQLYKNLTNDGVQCFFDRESIAWGSNWVVELDRAVADCDIMVVVLSLEYCKSEWGLIENTSARIDDPAGLRRKIRPLLLEPCREVLPAFLKPIQHIDVSSPEKFKIEYPKISRELGGVTENHDNPGTTDPDPNFGKTTADKNFSGKAKVDFCRNLGQDWKKLADILEIENSDQNKFEKGDEGRDIWVWLYDRRWLGKLPDALDQIDRPDLAEDLRQNPK